MYSDSMSSFVPVLTPRQDRLEATIERAVRVGSTRSELREAVYQLVDLFRLQGVPAANGIHAIVETAARAARAGFNRPDHPEESPADRLQLIESWSTHRYARAD